MFYPSKKKFVDITKDFSIQEFELVKNFILEKGDRRFYRNYDNNNPHYDFKNFQVYLNAEIGQKNLYNDPEISDFNEITIHNGNADIQYYTLRIVREGDIENKDIHVDSGMKVNHLYLMNTYERNLKVMRIDLMNIYLPEIRLIAK
ncbi:MAG: hypothetical protein L3J29_10475 [Cyclobacteriaceae bacterium]|nr:hypothetical protein [Cyclobacteriaceae bacterium]